MSLSLAILLAESESAHQRAIALKERRAALSRISAELRRRNIELKSIMRKLSNVREEDIARACRNRTASGRVASVKPTQPEAFRLAVRQARSSAQ